MTPDEWQRRAEAHLSQREDQGDHATINSGGDVELAEWFEFEERLAHVRAMSPRLNREKAQEQVSKLARKGSGAGRPASPLTMQQNRLWRAAGHARSLARLWDDLHPERPRKRPPIHPNQIVAEWSGLDRQQIDEYANRPSSRWPEKYRP